MYKKATLSLVLVVAVLFGASPALADGELRTQGSLSLRDGLYQRVQDRLAGLSYVSDEVLVKFEGEETFRRVPTRSGERAQDAVLRYRARTDVVYAEPNYIARALFVPNDTYYFPYQWHFDNPVYGGVNAESAWDVSSGAGVVVAVVDTGVAYENNGSTYKKAPDFENTLFVGGYDFVENDTHPNDDHGHGTHVAGTIAQSTNNNLGVAGLAHGASIMPIKVLNSGGSGTYADIADGIRFAADNGADVINMSLGGSTGSTALEEALAYAYSKGVTIVAAAGNDGEGELSYPAAYNDYVIAVGATRFDETLSYYSNYGAGLDIVAPGGDTRVDQNGDGYGDGVLQETFAPSCSGPFWRPRCTYDDFGYYFYQGTSMASPHVAAVAALVLANGNAATPAEVQNVLQSTADDLGPAGWDSTFGWGLVNASAALGSAPPPPPPPPPAENQAPIADAGPDQTAQVGETLTFDASSSTDPDGSIVLYQWDFGGGGQTATTVISTIVYGDAGEYTVTLTVTDNDGAADSDTASVVITEAPPPPPPPPPPGPVEIFFDSFENGEWNGLWSQDGQDAWKDSGREHTDGRQAAQADGDAVNAALTSIVIDLQGGTSATVSFDWFIERSLDSGEYLAFDVSTDGGGTWTEYARIRGNVDPEDTWQARSVVVSSAGTLRMRFRATIDRGSEDAYVDTVRVTAE